MDLKYAHKEKKLLSHVVLFDAIKYEGDRATIIATLSILG